MSTARPIRRTRAGLTFIFFAVAALLYTAPPRGSVAAAGETLSATYRDGTLRVSIPYDESVARRGSLRVEVLSPDDKIVAEATKPLASASETGPWNVSVSLAPKLSLEDLVWHRARIGTKVVSLSEILRLPVVRLMAQRAYAAGSRASLRVVAAESKNGDPLRDSRIKLELVNGETSVGLFEGQTDALGTAEVAFTVPPASFGSRTLRVTAETPLGLVTANQPVQLERRNK